MYEQQTEVRVGDAEREAVAERLRRAHGEGRIDTQELQERVGRCYQARTAGQLAALVADLPGEGRGRSAEPIARPGDPRRWLIRVVPVLIALWVVAAVVHSHVLWLAAVILLVARVVVGGRRGRFGGGAVGGPGQLV